MVGILSIQINPKVNEKQTNFETIRKFIEQNTDKKLDLVVMPEFFSTGISDKAFTGSPEDEFGGAAVEYFKDVAKEFNTNIICGTVIEKIADKYYNTSFALNRNGEIIGKYRKIHLYNYMGGSEGALIISGKDEVIADFDFGKVGMAICFDIRYPMFYRKLVQMGADIIVSPTAWVMPNDVFEDEKSRDYARDMWVSMVRTRAYDNMAYIVISDQVGKSNFYQSTLGCSLIVSPVAEVLADAKYNETAIYAEIDLESLKYLRSQYPIVSID